MVKFGLLDEAHWAFWSISRPRFASISKWRPDQKIVDVITNQIYRGDDPPRFNQGMKSYVNQLLLTLMTGHVASIYCPPPPYHQTLRSLVSSLPGHRLKKCVFQLPKEIEEIKTRITEAGKTFPSLICKACGRNLNKGFIIARTNFNLFFVHFLRWSSRGFVFLNWTLNLFSVIQD